MSEIFEVNINENSRVPKYKQIVDSILNGIDGGEIKIGEKLKSQYFEELKQTKK